MRYLCCEVECLRTERKLALQEKLLIYRDKNMVGTVFLKIQPLKKTIGGQYSAVQRNVIQNVGSKNTEIRSE